MWKLFERKIPGTYGLHTGLLVAKHAKTGLRVF